jgi:hypothetical protein
MVARIIAAWQPSLAVLPVPPARRRQTGVTLTSGPPEAAPKASPSCSVSEKLARYGSAALSSVEHLTLLVGAESIAKALIRHFGSLKALSRASFLELRQLLPQQKAELWNPSRLFPTSSITRRVISASKKQV